MSNVLDKLEADLEIDNVDNPPTHQFNTPNKKDIKAIEKELLKHKTDDNSEFKNKKEKKQKESKQDIVNKIKEVYAANGKEIDEAYEKRLLRNTKDQLYRQLGNLLDNGMNELTGQDDKTVLEESGIEYQDEPVDQPPEFRYDPVPNPMISSNANSIEVGAKALFNLNKLISSALSVANENVLKEHTGLSIKDYPDKLDEKREDLIELYREIYKQYASELNTYLSPVNMVILINSQCIMQSVVNEAQKKSLDA